MRHVTLRLRHRGRRVRPRRTTVLTTPGDGALLEPLIRKLESVGSLTDGERRAVEALPASVRRLDARQEIVSFGERPVQCCLVLEGWLCRQTTLADGGRQILGLYLPGDTPDLQSLHLGVMDHSLASLTPCRIAQIPHPSMRALIRTHPGLMTALWRVTLIDAANHRERITSIGRKQALDRIAHLFCELYLRLSAVGLASDLRFPLPLSQPDLADALGITSVHLNRTLRELRGRRLIELRARQVTIPDWGRLVEAGQFDSTYLHLEKAAPGGS